MKFKKFETMGASFIVSKNREREMPTLAIETADGEYQKLAKFFSEEDAETFCRAIEGKLPFEE